MTDLDEFRQILHVKPGDRVLLKVADGFDPTRCEDVAERLKERFPDVEFAVLSGVEVVAVQSKEE